MSPFVYGAPALSVGTVGGTAVVGGQPRAHSPGAPVTACSAAGEGGEGPEEGCLCGPAWSSVRDAGVAGSPGAVTNRENKTWGGRAG